mgnify:CR=1 FL=1
MTLGEADGAPPPVAAHELDRLTLRWSLMAIGEMRQLASCDALDFSERDYYQLIECKTASLIEAACRLGVVGVGALAGLGDTSARRAPAGATDGASSSATVRCGSGTVVLSPAGSAARGGLCHAHQSNRPQVRDAKPLRPLLCGAGCVFAYTA